MKWIIGVFSVIGIVLVFLFCPIAKPSDEVEYLRIHIRANSNITEDQNVKYKVKDEIVDYLIPFLADVHSFNEAKRVVANNFMQIENVANKVLKQNGFSYTSDAQIKKEYFPTRTYDDITLKEGYYDALIISLGSGSGNNWWCIVFPAFCFTKSQNYDKIEYISLIWEIIKSVTRS